MTLFRFIITGFICCYLTTQPVQADPLTILLEQGQQNLALGHYYEASSQLQQLEMEALQQQDNYTATLAKGLQGYIALQRYDNALAEQLLTAALNQSQQNAWPDLTIRFAVYLGELNEKQQHLSQARSYFTLALDLAEKISDKSFLISSLINLAQLAIVDNQVETAWQPLQRAATLLENLPVSPTSSQLWLNLGYQTLRLIQLTGTNKTALLPQRDHYLTQAFYALDKALTQAKANHQPRTQASALEYLAALYKRQQRSTEAIQLLEEGINVAQKEEAHDILIDLEWLLGEVYKMQQQPTQAIAAYRRALIHLETIRLDIPVFYQKDISSFKKTFAPLYLDLADLLLQQAPLVRLSQQQALLREAQSTLELMKKSELEDYFQSRCEIVATPINLQKKDPHAAAIYPISLPDRLELIVYTKDGLHQFTQPVTAQELKKQAKLYSDNLRGYVDFSQSKTQAQLLYQWLITPIKPLLEKQHIETLIYIPDGKLRLIPLSALYDGKKFLIEQYAVVTSPGMSLIETNTNPNVEKNILIAGMSRPGDVISELPKSLLMDFVGLASSNPNPNRGFKREIQHSDEPEYELTAVETEQKMRQLREALQKPGMLEKLKQELALPGVETEIKQLAAKNDTPYLLNESFSLANLTQALTTQPHQILHIASHGFFGATAEESFVMTYDKILTITKLESLLNSEFFKRHPLDLITLSACQTAKGDERSPLGISGIAIKAKVHSALGSLWSVSDQATWQLMTTFYQILKTSQLNKAKALQQAEISLLKQNLFSNPSEWSPFILVGDWL